VGWGGGGVGGIGIVAAGGVAGGVVGECDGSIFSLASGGVAKVVAVVSRLGETRRSSSSSSDAELDDVTIA